MTQAVFFAEYPLFFLRPGIKNFKEICSSLGFNPTSAAAAIVVSGWNGHFLPIDGLPAMCMGLGNYTLKEFWKFTVPQYFIRLIALTAGCLLMFPV